MLCRREPRCEVIEVPHSELLGDLRPSHERRIPDDAVEPSVLSREHLRELQFPMERMHRQPLRGGLERRLPHRRRGHHVERVVQRLQLRLALRRVLPSEERISSTISLFESNSRQAFLARVRARVSVFGGGCDPPIDPATQVSVFLNGLRDGPVRTQLFREYPNTLEVAMSRALEEEFSLKQARRDGGAFVTPYPSRTTARPRHNGPEPMELGAIDVRPSMNQPVTCFRCGKRGHMARECRSKPFAQAQAPVARNQRIGGNRFRSNGGARKLSKNFRSQ